jgi:replicative DNA helicase
MGELEVSLLQSPQELAAFKAMSTLSHLSPLNDPANVYREPPHSVEAEQGVLGSILITPVTILEAQEQITRDHFYEPAHRKIWDALVAMNEQKKPIDIISVTQELRDQHQLEGVGGAAFVAELFTFVPTAANVGFYLEIMRDKFVLRQTIATCSEAVRRAYEQQAEVEPLLDEVQGELTAIALNKLEESPLRRIADDVGAVLEEIENAHLHRGRTLGLPTPFKHLNKKTNGMQVGDMIVIAARPSMGKTALMTTIMQHVACDRIEDVVSRKTKENWKYKGVPVAIFSLETSRYRLVRRMLCARAGLNIHRLRDGNLKGVVKGQDGVRQLPPEIATAAGELISAPIYIDETPGLPLFQFKARARYAVATLGVKLIAIDYVQLMTADSRRSSEKDDKHARRRDAANAFERAIELTRISATIKQVARELNIPIIVLAQLNREADKQGGGKPRMSHLRECGAFEQDADHVWLIWRPEYYEDDEDKKKKVEGEAELIVAKNKDGPTEPVVKLTFLKEFTRFEMRSDEDEPDE